MAWIKRNLVLVISGVIALGFLAYGGWFFYSAVQRNKDIDTDAFVFQSKITDFDVVAGKDYFIRVSGEGLYPGDPNTSSGVVHLDFSFSFPMAVDEERHESLSPVYPNPARDLAYVDVRLAKASEVTLDILDLTGRAIRSQYEGLHAPGKVEAIPLVLSSLQPGTYFVRLRGDNKNITQKLIVLNK